VYVAVTGSVGAVGVTAKGLLVLQPAVSVTATSDISRNSERNMEVV